MRKPKRRKTDMYFIPKDFVRRCTHGRSYPTLEIRLLAKRYRYITNNLRKNVRSNIRYLHRKQLQLSLIVHKMNQYGYKLNR